MRIVRKALNRMPLVAAVIIFVLALSAELLAQLSQVLFFPLC